MNWFENIVEPCRRVVPKFSILNEGRTCLSKNSVLTDYLKVGLHEWSRSCNFLNKLIREFLLSIFRSEALFGHPVQTTYFTEHPLDNATPIDISIIPGSLINFLFLCFLDNYSIRKIIIKSIIDRYLSHLLWQFCISFFRLGPLSYVKINLEGAHVGRMG